MIKYPVKWKRKKIDCYVYWKRRNDFGIPQEVSGNDASSFMEGYRLAIRDIKKLNK